ncbi:MAG: hypothetical protein KDE47_22010, partial [Caldilineaceae bacterium]|nr:hypothetical protein [Caldilineaceae bacterium]
GNGQNGVNGNESADNGSSRKGRKTVNARTLQITFQRTGNLERDKFRLREIHDIIANPRGRDRFQIVLANSSSSIRLGFPNDYCTISERLVDELARLKVEVSVE